MRAGAQAAPSAQQTIQTQVCVQPKSIGKQCLRKLPKISSLALRLDNFTYPMRNKSVLSEVEVFAVRAKHLFIRLLLSGWLLSFSVPVWGQAKIECDSVYNRFNRYSRGNATMTFMTHAPQPVMGYETFRKYLLQPVDDNLIADDKKSVSLDFVVQSDSSISCFRLSGISDTLAKLAIASIRKVKFLPAVSGIENSSIPLHVTFVFKRYSLCTQKERATNTFALQRQSKNEAKLRRRKINRDKL